MSLSQLLHKRIWVLAERQRRLGLWCRLATCWAGAGLLGLALVILQQQSESHFQWALLLVIIFALVCFSFVALGLFLQRGLPAQWRELARQIERVHPDL